MVRHGGRALVLLVLIMAVAVAAADAQFVERPRLMVVQDTTAFGFAGEESRLELRPGQSALELLQNATLDVNGPVVKANLNALSYYAKIGNQFYPLLVFTSFPVLTPNRDQLQEYLGNEILNQYGGLLNVTLARRWHFLHDNRPGEEGLSLNVVGGGKLLEVIGLTTNEYTPTAHLGGSADFRINLTDSPDPASLAGLVQFSASLLANYVSGDSYLNLFMVGENSPSRLPITLSLTGSVHVFDQFYVGGGYVRSTESRLPDRKFFSVSVSRR